MRRECYNAHAAWHKAKQRGSLRFPETTEHCPKKMLHPNIVNGSASSKSNSAEIIKPSRVTDVVFEALFSNRTGELDTFVGTSVDAFVGRFVRAFVGVLEGLKTWKSTLVRPVVGALVGHLVGPLNDMGPLVVPLVDPLVGQGSLSPALCVAQLLRGRVTIGSNSGQNWVRLSGCRKRGVEFKGGQPS